MGPIEIILIIACAGIVIGVVAHSIIRKKQGNSGCCDCSSCPSACHCKDKKTDNK